MGTLARANKGQVCIVTYVGLPSTQSFQDVSLGQIDEGLKLQETLLKVIGELAHFKFKKPKPEGLLYDLRDALLHIHRVSDPSARS